MPVKIRELKAALLKTGFYARPGKGSHSVWKHSSLPATRITLAGKDGNDAKPYQIQDVQEAIKKLRGK